TSYTTYKSLMIVLSMLLLSGCHMRMEEAKISSDFPIEQQEMIINSFEEIFEAAPEFRIPISIVSPDEATVIYDTTCTDYKGDAENDIEGGVSGFAHLKPLKPATLIVCEEISEDRKKAFRFILI